MPGRIFVALLILILFSQTWAIADGGPLHQAKQTLPIRLGSSGGNVKNISSLFCCSGTLGALVTKAGLQYILSNNHVLARSGSASAGEDISQPGLIDNNCQVFQIVADFSQAIALGTKNVDAAIAKVRPNAVRSNGAILDLGTISSVISSPAIGLAVQKSGRTTGLTKGTVSSINTDVNVQYQQGCGSGKKFVISYQDQCVIGKAGFSAGGDSGSLIVTNNANKQPVGLLFAGSSTTTVANPISDVVAALNISFVGPANGTPTSPSLLSLQGPAESELTYAKQVKERHKKELFDLGTVLGIGIGSADDNPIEAAIVIYTQSGHPLPERLADRLDGLRVKVITTEPFVAYGNAEWGDNSCGRE
jgi:hypothetical protein